jgi:hypothetical protein
MWAPRLYSLLVARPMALTRMQALWAEAGAVPKGSALLGSSTTWTQVGVEARRSR